MSGSLYSEGTGPLSLSDCVQPALNERPRGARPQGNQAGALRCSLLPEEEEEEERLAPQESSRWRKGLDELG